MSVILLDTVGHTVLKSRKDTTAKRAKLGEQDIRRELPVTTLWEAAWQMISGP